MIASICVKPIHKYNALAIIGEQLIHLSATAEFVTNLLYTKIRYYTPNYCCLNVSRRIGTYNMVTYQNFCEPKKYIKTFRKAESKKGYVLLLSRMNEPLVSFNGNHLNHKFFGSVQVLNMV